MPRFRRLETLWLPMLFGTAPLYAQMPFYTDDPSVTEPKKLHVEIFDEYDGLQTSQFPDLRQNTANFKINFSPVRGLELDLDAPYLTISRTAGAASSSGVGDTNLGAKWNLRETPPETRAPAFAVSFYVEFPTGNSQQELGSGLSDYWLNFILQKPLSEATRINVNLGLLFAGNTSTGAVGIQTRRGQVYTGGISVLHDTTTRLTWGGEALRRHFRRGGIGQDPAAGYAGSSIRDSRWALVVFRSSRRKVRRDAPDRRTNRNIDRFSRCHRIVDTSATLGW